MKRLAAVCVACFVLGCVAGVWMGVRTPRTGPQATAADKAASALSPSAQQAPECQDSLGSLGSMSHNPQVPQEPSLAGRKPETMIVPVRGENVGGYGWYRDTASDEWKFRDGLEISCDSGSEVVAALSGTVTRASPASGGGYLVTVMHASGVETTYENLRAAWVDVGKQVTLGEPLGDIGSAPSGLGGVLQFAVKCGGEFVDPVACLGQRF